MKITENMIAPDLRSAGKLFKKITGETDSLKPPKLRRTDPRGRSFETLLRRDDGSYLRILITKPKKRDRVPGVLWLHGGGFLTGMPEMVHFSPARIIKNDCVIVSPDYTLSSKKPYPAALVDCYAALLWMVKNADSLGIDRERIYVGGESAGGGLCVSVCMLAKRLGTVNIACQMPLYPMLDDRMDTDSMKGNNAPVWNENRNSQAWALYLRGLEKISVYAAPGRADDVLGMPPAISFVGSIDPFCDETAEYISKLCRAGIPVDFCRYPGCFHAFDMLVPWSKEAREAAKFFKTSFRRACVTYHAAQPEIK